MKTKLYRELAGFLFAVCVALATVTPRVALADSNDNDGDSGETRVALKQVDREQTSLDDDVFVHDPQSQPAYVSFDGRDEPPTATTSYVLFGVGGAAAASAVVFGALKAKASSDAKDKCDDSVCLGSARDALDREERYALATDISAGIAVVSASAGLYYWFKARRDKKRWLDARNSVHPTAVPGGVGMSFSGSF